MSLEGRVLGRDTCGAPVVKDHPQDGWASSSSEALPCPDMEKEKLGSGEQVLRIGRAVEKAERIRMSLNLYKGRMKRKRYLKKESIYIAQDCKKRKALR